MTAPDIRERPSPNHDSRGDPPHMRPINMLVLHYTGMQSAAAALDRLCDAAARVSAHYAVEEDGTLWRLVPEARRAFHAGVSFWQGDTDLNFVSVGVEIVNPGHEWGYRPFPELQMAAAERLCRDILSRHPIPPYRVVGHSDIAPDRKADPGELFDWPRLARAGLVTTIPTGGVDPGWTDTGTIAALARYGYDVAEPAAAVIAFQRRFRPARFDGVIDAESRTILRGLLV